MITASDSWKDIQQRFLLPETFIEIDCAITEDGAQEAATGSATNEEIFSNVDSILDNDENVAKYATNELNLWALDGTYSVLPDNGVYGAAGYVSANEGDSGVTLTFPTIRESAVAGITIVWSDKFGEYSPIFTVSAWRGTTKIAELTVTDNTSTTSVVSLNLENYDSISVAIHTWSLPNRRRRIEKITIGHVLTLTKSDLMSYSHEQHGDLLSGELPKYSIEFTLDNTDGRWNPNNPTGMEQYLSERQKLTVRYGMDINGSIEWIKAGTFYLSEWDTPSNGLEAKFVARDAFEFMLDEKMRVGLDASLGRLIDEAIPDNVTVFVDSRLNNYSAKYIPESSSLNSVAEVIQMCANAGEDILRCDRDGAVYVEPLNKTLTDYRITQALSYSHPEVSLSKPLKAVTVDYGADTPYELTHSNNGETRSVSNKLIQDSTRAASVAQWVNGVLKNRKTVSGEFRADPRLDLYDVVTVESKYGALTPVVITNIKYTFNGSFRGSYEGRVLEVD